MTVKHLKMSTSTHTNVRGKEGIKKVKDCHTSGKKKQNEFAQSKGSFYFLSRVLKISFIVNHITSI